MKSLKAQMAIAIVCVVLGLMLAYQFQAVKNINSVSRGQEIEKLTSQVNMLQKQKLDFENSIATLEKKIEEYEKSAATSNGLASNLKNELDNVRLLAGLTNVEGPGVVVTVTPQIQDLNSSEPVMVNFTYLLLIVNELNASGAEAVMVNNQRIVSTTQIRQAGSTIVINDVRNSAFDKFEIKAIGDSTTLETGLNMVGGVKQELSTYGINIKIQKSNSVTIFKYNKVIDFKYAKQVKEGE
jgi:uncharacterized protein YlxW (UPF0749 family)